MRIGIHTVIKIIYIIMKGEFLGGVIGTDIIRYDLFGVDVLIANKMESNGEPGRVMVSEECKNLVE
jgi:class 3 adenylate cyclase